MFCLPFSCPFLSLWLQEKSDSLLSSRTRCPDWGCFLNRQYSRFQNRNDDSSEHGEGSADQPKAVGRTLTSQEHKGCRSASPVYFPRARPFFLFRYTETARSSNHLDTYCVPGPVPATGMECPRITCLLVGLLDRQVMSETQTKAWKELRREQDGNSG